MDSIPKDKSRGWTLEVNGRVIEEVSRATLSNPRYGVLEYGQSPQGFDTWSFHENGGGGSVIIPYAVINEEIHVGLINQVRSNQGGKVWNVPRGFLALGENHFQTAMSELEQEVGYKSFDQQLLEGTPLNPNSTFFITEPGKAEGVRIYAMLVGEKELIKGADNLLVFNPQVLKPISKNAEQIFGSKFFPWKQACEVGDMFTIAAISRLLATFTIKILI